MTMVDLTEDDFTAAAEVPVPTPPPARLVGSGAFAVVSGDTSYPTKYTVSIFTTKDEAQTWATENPTYITEVVPVLTPSQSVKHETLPHIKADDCRVVDLGDAAACTCGWAGTVEQAREDGFLS